MHMEYFGAIAQTVQNIGQGIVALLPIIVIPVGMYKVVQWSFSARAGLGKLTGSLTDRTKGLTNKARERAQQSNLYQRPQMAKDFRKQERRRANVEDYAQRVTESSRWRRRAAGVGNTAGQQRALQSAQDILRKQRHEETERAAKNMAQRGFEGDADFMGIAQTETGRNYTSARTGEQIQVSEAVRQAAINNLVQQGRTGQVRELEAAGGGRAPGGVARTDLHNMLDHAYEDYGQKIAEKAPDLAPSRRASNGAAAFTDLQAGDVTKWHHSTIDAAEGWYTSPTMVDPTTNQVVPITAAERTSRQAARRQMLNSYKIALGTEQRSSIGVDQIRHLERIFRADPTLAADPSMADAHAAIMDRYNEVGATPWNPPPP